MCAKERLDNDDWVATCEIFDPSRKSVVEYLDGCGGSICAIDVSVHVQGVAFIRQVSANAKAASASEVDPRFAYRVLSPREVPVFRVQFKYSASESSIESVSVSSLDYPEPWPREAKQAWLDWLNKEVSEVLRESEISYCVCEFIECKGLDFFDHTCSHETLGYSAVACTTYPLGNKVPTHMITIGDLMPSSTRQTLGVSNPEIVDLDDFARVVIASHWEKWVNIECPICFSEVAVSDAVEITCKHLLCVDCITTYAKLKAEEIHTHRVNPFKCPLTSCRREMKVIGCVKRFLDDDEMSEVRLWYRNLKQPLSTLLTVCPRKRCGERAMRRTEVGSRVVFCDVCGWTWCEVCVGRVKDSHDECDSAAVLRLCRRYRRASDEVKVACREKWPWLPDYSNALTEDEEALRWVKENASRCPTCRTGIERLEGCFHMQCTQCATHFCYECGEELFPPYYGTHHCWERENLLGDQHFVFEGD